MLVLITYDVNTEDAAEKKWLRQIAKQCTNYGQRVQCSVLECLLDPAQCKLLQAKLLAIMHLEKTVCTFITLGSTTRTKSSALGVRLLICQKIR